MQCGANNTKQKTIFFFFLFIITIMRRSEGIAASAAEGNEMFIATNQS
jgi:hypothetical protein